MQRCPEELEAAELPNTPFQDPQSTHALLALTAKLTGRAALCFRLAALVTLCGAIIFDGLNLTAQIFNVMAIVSFVLTAVYVNEASASASTILERERHLAAMCKLLKRGRLHALQDKKSAQSELGEIYRVLQGLEGANNQSAAKTIQNLIQERDRAWAALLEKVNMDATAVPTTPKAQLKLVVGGASINDRA